MLNALNINTMDDLTDDHVKVLYRKFVKNRAVNVDKNINKTTDKYKVLLKFVNKILFNIGKENIVDLIEFKNIDRNDIAKNSNNKVLKRMSNSIFKHFNKKKCGYYRKTDNKALNCLRGMCKEIGLELRVKKHTKTVNCKVVSEYLYNIC